MGQEKYVIFFLCCCSQAGGIRRAPEAGAAQFERSDSKVLRGRKERAGLGREGEQGGARVRRPGGGRRARAALLDKALVRLALISRGRSGSRRSLVFARVN